MPKTHAVNGDDPNAWLKRETHLCSFFGKGATSLCDQAQRAAALGHWPTGVLIASESRSPDSPVLKIKGGDG